MPYFICRSKPYQLATNLKVMFSTLMTQPHLDNLSRPSQLWHTYCRRVRIRDLGPRYLIVRNPYTRLISFFNDKFRQHPLGVNSATPYDNWQTCQKLYFPCLGITRATSAEAIRRILSEVPFEQFIAHLPQVFQRDGHLQPQNLIRWLTVKGIPFGTFSVDRVLKMERDTDMRFLSEELGVDTRARQNATVETSMDELYTPALLATVNQLYADDFREYEYELHW